MIHFCNPIYFCNLLHLCNLIHFCNLILSNDFIIFQRSCMCIIRETWIYCSLREKFTKHVTTDHLTNMSQNSFVTDTGAPSTFTSLSYYKGLQCPLANCTLLCSEIKLWTPQLKLTVWCYISVTQRIIKTVESTTHSWLVTHRQESSCQSIIGAVQLDHKEMDDVCKAF
jgi:hypothetical protein